MHMYIIYNMTVFNMLQSSLKGMLSNNVDNSTIEYNRCRWAAAVGN